MKKRLDERTEVELSIIPRNFFGNLKRMGSVREGEFTEKKKRDICAAMADYITKEIIPSLQNTKKNSSEIYKALADRLYNTFFN